MPIFSVAWGIPPLLQWRYPPSKPKKFIRTTRTLQKLHFCSVLVVLINFLGLVTVYLGIL